MKYRVEALAFVVAALLVASFRTEIAELLMPPSALAALSPFGVPLCGE